MTYTVAELLGDPELATISLTPGVGEQREITWAHVCELADPWNWLGDGALVMTTGLDIPEAKISRSTTSSDRTPRASRLSRSARRCRHHRSRRECSPARTSSGFRCSRPRCTSRSSCSRRRFRTPTGPDHTALDVHDLGAVQAAVDAIRPGLEVVDANAHDWAADPLSKNTWMTHRPGQLSRYLTELQQPQGVLHFATTDNANLWGGFVDGAIESGLREARRVAEALQPQN